MKKNRKRGLAPGTAGFPKLYSGKEPKWGQNEGPRRGILKRRGGERNARPKQFYNTGRRCDIAPSCFLLSGKGPKLSLSLSPHSLIFSFPYPPFSPRYTPSLFHLHVCTTLNTTYTNTTSFYQYFVHTLISIPLSLFPFLLSSSLPHYPILISSISPSFFLPTPRIYQHQLSFSLARYSHKFHAFISVSRSIFQLPPSNPHSLTPTPVFTICLFL